MIKYKSTLLSGLTVETVAPNMTEVVTHVEKWYSTYVVKCEIVDSTADTNFISQDWKNITDPVLRRKAYCKANKEKMRAGAKVYHELNKDKLKAYSKIWRKENKEKIKAYHKDRKTTSAYQADKEYAKNYYLNNKEKCKAQNRVYRQNNKDKLNQLNRERRKKLILTDINFKLRINLRHRLKEALKGNFKSGSAVNDLGCSIEQLKIHLESKFQEGMSWDNWSFKGWHLDHIKPLSSFDLTDRNQLLQACHYTNLQPLWAKENLSKGNKVK